MNSEKIEEAVKMELVKTTTVVDGEFFINDKKALAYKIFEIIERFDPNFMKEWLENKERVEE